MGININSKELVEILNSTPASQNIMLIGRHGIGKSEILTNYFSSQNMKVVALFLGQMSDPGDLIGLPTKNEETGRTDFIPPYWFPKDGTPIVLFLDELNRARPEVLQVVMDLVLNRKLAGRYLPEGSRIISAINAGEEYQTTDLDPALVSRFNIYNFMPSANEWLHWAEKAGIDYRVIEFISNESDYLDGIDGKMKKAASDTGLDKTPDRRAWKKVSDVVKDVEDFDETLTKLIAGIVGPAATARFISSVRGSRVLSGAEVLLEFKKHSKTLQKYKTHQLSIVNDGVIRYLETTDTLKTDKTASKAVSGNLIKYVELLEGLDTNEAMAHFCNILSTKDAGYHNAMSFIIGNAPSIFEKVNNFIMNIDKK